MEVQEFADILNVPVLKAGVHHSHNVGDLAFTEEDLYRIAHDSTALQDYIQKSVELQRYDGNEELSKNLKKPIPDVLNVQHQDEKYFPIALQKHLKDVDTTFHVGTVNNEPWLMQNFHRVPSDVAKTLQEHYPYRSIELVPLKVQDTLYPQVIRSTAFLNKYTSPGVKGQSPDLTVEFVEGESPVVVLMCDDIDTELPITTNQEASMPNEQTVSKTSEEMSGSDVSELAGQIAAKDAEIDRLQAELAQEKSERVEIAELKASHESALAQIAELKAKEDEADVREFCATFELTPLVQGDQKYVPSPSFMSIVRKHITASPSTGVIEFAEGSQTVRETMKSLFQDVAELAAKQSVLVPISDTKPTHAVPGQKQTIETRIAELQQATPGMKYGDAWVQASAEFQEVH
jgi:hypothetical protein